MLKKEKLWDLPDSILPTLGGQAALNLAMELEENGFLEKSGVRLIGTSSTTIRKAEDRQEFKDTMEKIGEPIAAGKVVTDIPAGAEFAEEIGYPVVCRPAYTLGGSGGGIAHDRRRASVWRGWRSPTRMSIMRMIRWSFSSHWRKKTVPSWY